ncbi:hypothetical protein [Kribbella solani]|uniref:Uncharacterized protein n=1 Tax=Kribbella solani TaxID=236067 RepID=A0A841DH22_9ACTN|nr:hypothetical protein [Kribbella solani]MBB5976759.1 hypothetical protein [Kribbella solani]
MTPGRWPRAGLTALGPTGHRAALAAAGLFLGGVLTVGCGVTPAQPAAADLRTSEPPWDAPRDAVSYIDKAGFERLPLDFSGPSPYTLKISVTVDGKPVQVPAGIGVDRLRAEQAAVHTHTADGVVWVEAKSAADRPTLSQFFTLWGLRYTPTCLANACQNLTITTNNTPTPWNTPLLPNAHLTITVRNQR